MKVSAVYAEQWGYIWKFTPRGFIAFLESAIKSGKYDLNKGGKRLQRKPRTVYRPAKLYRNEYREDYIDPGRISTNRRDVLTFPMLDTDRPDWIEMRKEVLKRMREGQ